MALTQKWMARCWIGIITFLTPSFYAGIKTILLKEVKIA
jgi:hypothetical protein